MESLKGRDLLSLADLTVAELHSVLSLAIQLKSGMRKLQRRKVLGLMFSKASTRTRVSFSVAMYQLGGHIIDLNPSVTQVSRGEPLVDTARVLGRYLDAIAIRTFEQKDLETFASCAEIPVINALTDREHPCQVLADLMTVQECFNRMAGLTLTYLGDGANNMAHSLLLGCAMVGMNIRIATPSQYPPNPEIVEQAKAIAAGKTEVIITDDPAEAVQKSHVLYTDVWASMGQESEADDRIPLFMPFQVNDSLLAKADDDAIVLHCLPAHRDQEITDGVIEGVRSRVWDQAENRMHAQKALLASLLSDD
ncbi:ornithine carbamoyltransferase [Limnospira fusiformis KN01]|uniref:Ornithine carbamoyltransferase n=1 Tax=Limnospira fusiformis PMC 851.14 TaxID=2219512 RepID=A0ABU9EEW3_LIMFS|nr:MULTISPECIES: ornithine carbamoyltransferase [Limnospira]MDY7055420.1 ornithine carbamoyltransferase [Limnospira fusiformis LS22]MDT9190225.1 ornithine carbamoyltransferase [Limnospira sp. PMC 894.15]MDT9200056.1 ornithine carbamoyltransferase [Limnospira sp. PMC 1042.18]MDT9277035.1 ornithine carbamoyltransferase [Limnospira sp. PMC 737.11]ULB43724.1 ornithine carbamoyltransferase [Limnospira fusiformis KN01]